MADLSKWAAETPAANLLLVIGIAVVVMAMVVIVLTITVATILSVTAFFSRVPFEFFGFKVWQSGFA